MKRMVGIALAVLFSVVALRAVSVAVSSNRQRVIAFFICGFENFTRYTISSEFTSRRGLRNDRADCGTIPAINYGDPMEPTFGSRCQQ